MINFRNLKERWKHIFNTYGKLAVLGAFVIAFTTLLLIAFVMLGAWLGTVLLAAKYVGESVAGIIIILPGAIKMVDWAIKLFEKLSDAIDTQKSHGPEVQRVETFQWDGWTGYSETNQEED